LTNGLRVAIGCERNGARNVGAKAQQRLLLIRWMTFKAGLDISISMVARYTREVSKGEVLLNRDHAY
jgi:hypothetical protein